MSDPRSIEEILSTGASWVTESEFERLGELATRAERYRQALELITALDPDWTGRDMESVYGIARAALSDSLAEGEER